MIKTNVAELRDPFIVVADGVYYMYGTETDGDWEFGAKWGCYKNDSGSLAGEWVKLDKELYVDPTDAYKNHWAPEVHQYKDKFYMFTTYFSKRTNHKGCTILRSDAPEGPFAEITDGVITPSDWDSIDATLYVDDKGTPWMIFVHEWVSTEDKVGRMAAMRLSNDLTCAVGEPIELFRADEAAWAKGNVVTDGCYLYKTASGSLLMLWSNFEEEGLVDYAVGIARSENGKVDGRWIQDEHPLYTKHLTGEDGGHGMVFRDVDGQLYLCIHSPNKPPEKTVLLPLCESGDTLRVVQ